MNKIVKCFINNCEPKINKVKSICYFEKCYVKVLGFVASFSSACIMAANKYDECFKQLCDLTEENKIQNGREYKDGVNQYIKGIKTESVDEKEINMRHLYSEIKRIKEEARQNKIKYSDYVCENKNLYQINYKYGTIYVNAELLKNCLEFTESNKVYLHGQYKKIGFVSKNETRVAVLMPCRNIKTS